MNRIEIAQGAHLTHFDAARFKRCRVSVNFCWPAQRETATADALLPIVMERSCADYPDMTALSKKLAALYGAALSVDSSLVGTTRVLSVSVTGIRDVFAPQGENLTQAYTQLALGVAFHPHFENGLFCAEDVEIEKIQLREQLEGEINDKRTYCIRQARRRFFGNAPAGIEAGGYLEEVSDVTPQSLTKAYETMRTTAQVEVMVLGADKETVRAAVCAQLAETQRAPATLPPVASAMPPVEAQQYRETMDTEQSKLCLLFTAGAPLTAEELTPMRVATALLGGTPTSRLFTHVREEQNLCYYCPSAFSSSVSMLRIDSGIQHENAAAARAAVLHEMQMLQTGSITKKELDDTKRSLVSSLHGVEDTLAGIESWYFSEILRGTHQSPKDVAEEIEKVSAQEVQRALAKCTLSVDYLITKEGAAHA